MNIMNEDIKNILHQQFAEMPIKSNNEKIDKYCKEICNSVKYGNPGNLLIFLFIL